MVPAGGVSLVIRILLVDDQEIVRAGLRTLLGVEPDIEVVGEAATGSEAVRETVRLRPDVVLMDIRMPDLDGIAATKQIVQSGAAARVCVLTTYSLDDYVFDALAAGASGFLLKTDTAERILAAIRAVADGQFSMGGEATAALVARCLASGRRTPYTEDLLAELTSREREVFEHVAAGLANAEIGELLFVGEGTVKTHVARILMKLGLRDRVQVVVFAHHNGLVR